MSGRAEDSMTPRECQAALSDDLGWGLGVVFRAYIAAAHAAVSELPGGPRGYQVLSAAVHSAVGSQLSLAQHLGIDRTMMTYLIDDLEEAGLIARRPDPADRRARRVVATEHGAELLVAMNRQLRAAEEQVLAPLDTEARATFRAQLRVLATQIDAFETPQSACELADQVDVELPSRKTSIRKSTPQPT